MLNVIGFRTNIGPGRLLDGEVVADFCRNCTVLLKLTENNVIGGIIMTVVSYDDDTGMASVMFDRHILLSTAETLLNNNDIFIFGDIDE